MKDLVLQEFKEGKEISSKGYALFSKDGNFKPYEFKRHCVGERDVLIEILYAGICHSDIHTARSEWGEVSYPLVPGHEIAGRVIGVGKGVEKFKVGDLVGVGCMVNSCQSCPTCQSGEEQFCDEGKTIFTYASKDIFHNGELTQGGYSSHIVVDENFVLKVPQNAKLECVAPLLCAGITTYSPLKRANIQEGDEVGIVGFGGLGHMAVQYAKSFGANVSVFATSESKRDLAFRLGAKHFYNVKNPKEIEGINNRFKVILSTVAQNYEISDYLKMLKVDGEMIIVGVPPIANPATLNATALIWNFRRKVYSSLIGGIRETQEMLDYSIKNEIYPMIEMIDIKELDNAYERVLKSDVLFRFVIDMKTLS
ncbi:NAD(P)-dependent alcohol dehydrogenase [Helicobacter brantae]|uniref:NAD(P)-dependent alcohol dehydrogenase n=1 Tax=Helicobacter brantae TaxID=375927 RepID=A0A3D8J3N4_9HELI|nr:NAD(P)-dependent alcohol dehydrogenase [Helicobacter brantae]RDU72089.1 NAD(P)-dependent alcohol dehydrogenase [Helicobacter brantae]